MTTLYSHQWGPDSEPYEPSAKDPVTGVAVKDGYVGGINAALRAIADLPAPASADQMNGHEDAYRAVEALVDAQTDDTQEALVERMAKAMERARKYYWTPEQFEIWWESDPLFMEEETSWGFFTGTEKERCLWEARIALEALASAPAPQDAQPPAEADPGASPETVDGWRLVVKKGDVWAQRGKVSKWISYPDSNLAPHESPLKGWRLVIEDGEVWAEHEHSSVWVDRLAK